MTAPHITAPAQHGIAIGSAKRYWRSGAGSSIASGAPTGFVSRRRSSGDWSRPSRRRRPTGRSVIGKAGGTGPKQTSRRTIERQRTESADLAETAPNTIPYVEADFTVLRNPEPHLLSRERMLEIVRQIIEIEGPIHRDEIARRVTQVCGYTRTGRRIVDAVVAGLKWAEQRGLVVA